MARIRNVFEIIELYGHDENFVPHVSEEFTPTTAPAGSRQKIDVLAERIQQFKNIRKYQLKQQYFGCQIF